MEERGVKRALINRASSIWNHVLWGHVLWGPP